MTESVEALVYEDKLSAISILEGATYLFENTILCDVTLIVEGQKIDTHKSILASASLYFRGMFCAGLKETNEKEITIHDVDYNAMKAVIRFFYTSSITLTKDNIFEVMNVVDLLGVASLNAACCAFLRNYITVHNCVYVYVVSNMHGYLDVADAAIKLAGKNFSHLTEIEEFLEMPFDMLLGCLEGKILNIPDEDFLLNKICAWLNHDPEQRMKHLKALLDQLNVYVVDLAKAECCLYQLAECEAQVCKWLDRIKHIRTRSIRLTTYNPQRYNKEQQVVLSCGGLTSGNAVPSVEALSLTDSFWRCMVPAPTHIHGFRVVPPLKVPRIYSATTYSDDYVYIIGGRNESGALASVERYSVEGNDWDEFITLPEPLEGAAATFSNGSIYLTGGFNTGTSVTNKAWVLEPPHSKWKALPPMLESRSHHGLVAVNGYLYAIAGSGTDGEVRCSVERMSIHTHQWYRLSPLQKARSMFGYTAIHNLIYVMGGLNGEGQTLRSVQVYDTLTHEWRWETPLSVARHSHSATVANGKIFIAAGTDGIHNLSSCDVFNPQTHLWHCKPSMARSRVGHAMATISVLVPPEPNV